MEQNKFSKLLDEIRRLGNHFFFPVLLIGLGVYLGYNIFLGMTEVGADIFMGVNCLIPLIIFAIGVVTFFHELRRFEEESKDKRYWWD